MFRSPLTDSVDRTISTPGRRRAGRSIDEPDTDCSDEELPTFWMDMSQVCTRGTDGVRQFAAQSRAMDRHNGSHVWRAIYEENCLKSALSGPTTCVTRNACCIDCCPACTRALTFTSRSTPSLQGARRARPSGRSEKVCRKLCQASRQVEEFTLFIRRLLRALRKAALALSRIDVRIGQDTEEDLRTQALMSRLWRVTFCHRAETFAPLDKKSSSATPSPRST